MEKYKIDPINIISNINNERGELKKKQEEIDKVANVLKDQFLETAEKKEYENYRAVKANTTRKTAMEKIESIRSFVELQKLSVDINKTIINTFEKEYKMKFDYMKYIDSNTDNTQSKTLTPSEIAKLAKKSK